MKLLKASLKRKYKKIYKLEEQIMFLEWSEIHDD